MSCLRADASLGLVLNEYTAMRGCGKILVRLLLLQIRELVITCYVGMAAVDCFWLVSISLASKQNFNECI